jgi:hypothetical protein
MAVSKRLRFEILKRDQHTCRYCGGKSPDVVLTVDHVVPIALGGGDDPGNLITACKDCNAGKSSVSPDAPLVAAVDDLAVKYALILNRIVEERTVHLSAENEDLMWFNRLWCRWKDGKGNPVPRDSGWKGSVLRFFAAGLNRTIIERALSTAMGNSKIRVVRLWSYFCGICWNQIRDITAEAANRINAEDEDEGVGDGFPHFEMFEEWVHELLKLWSVADAHIRYRATDVIRSTMSATCQAWKAQSLNDSGDNEMFLATRRSEDPDDLTVPSRWEFAHEVIASRIRTDLAEMTKIITGGVAH